MKKVLALAALSIGALVAHADVTVEEYGIAVRPDRVADYSMTAFPANPALFSMVSSTLDGFGDPITFTTSLSVRKIGLGWATWSGTYTGTVFYVPPSTGVTLVFPAGTKAVQLYAENETFGVFPLTAVAIGATSSPIASTQFGDGTGGATGWGFASTDGSDIVTVRLLSPMGVGFAFGDIATSRGPACSVDLNGDGLVDFSDYLDFLTLFDAQDPRVDFTGDGHIDFSDYLEFLNLFEAGC